jgi:uncharacterized protein YndB with AHSA1/START domain
MAEPSSRSGALLTLVVRRTIRATPERLFEAWTEPAHLLSWWGPRGVTCIGAEVDLRIGGRYRIENAFPDGRVVALVGEFEVIDRPHRLTYTGQVDGNDGAPERITVRFEPRDGGTEVIVTHERIHGEESRDQHQRGWDGCLEGLAEHAQATDAP